jgi:PKHD-type hydroxylase
MRLEKAFCVIESAFSKEFCARVVEVGEQAKSMDALVGRDPTNTVRDSSVSWLGKKDEHGWLYEAVTECVQKANQEHWRWEISEPESMQFTSYEPGQYYGWHTDQRSTPYPEKSRWPGLLRKLSLTLNLSEDGDYEGGDFVIEDLRASPKVFEQRIKIVTAARGHGAALIFPSHLFHKVTEVTSGTRRSLVAWFLGPPFV